MNLLLTLTLAPLLLAPQDEKPGRQDVGARDIAAHVASLEKRTAEIRLDEPQLYVAGRPISKALIDRQLVYIYGRQVLELLKLRILLDEEIASQVASGGAVDKFGVLDKEIDAKLDETKEQFKQQYPDLEFTDVLQAQGHTPASFRLNLESTLKFDRVFLPKNPHEIPDVTRAAIESQGGAEFAEKMFVSLKEAWDKAAEEGTEMPANPLYQRIMRQWVIKALLDVSDIKTPIDGLPEDACLSVNGKLIKTTDVLPMIEPFVKDYQRVQTMKWVGIVEALRAELESKGCYLSQEEYDAAWETKYGKYEGTPFNPQVIALAFKKFPSMDIYRAYFRLQESYAKLIAEEFDDAHLTAHAEKAKNFLGDGKVDAEVILVSAWNFYANAPKGPDAFDKARARAEECFQRLEAGEDYGQLLEEYSGFIDPPKNPQGPPAPQPRKGRFGMQGKNPLKNFLGETEFNTFLQGYSIGDIIFDEMEAGETSSPIRGAYGYYIVRVKNRTPGYKAVNIGDESKRELVTQDYLNTRFLEWSNEVLEKAEVEIR